MTSAFSSQNFDLLCFVLRPKLLVTPWYSLLSTFAFQSPIMKRTSFLGVSSRKPCRSSQNRSTQLLQHYGNPSLYLDCNAEEAEVEQFYEDLQDFLELTPQKGDVFIIWDCNANVGSQEIPAVIGKFGLGVHSEAGQRLTEICQENALVIANTLFHQHKRRLYTWTS